MSGLLASLRWLVLHLLRQPLTWLWLFVATAAWPLIWLFTPRALTSDAHLTLSLVYEAAFMGLVLGGILGGLILDGASWFLHPKGPLERLAHELAALAGTSFLLLLPTLALPLLVGSPATPIDAPDLAARCALTHLHLSALMVVLLRTPIPPGGRTSALILGVWVVPALLGPDRGIVACLDAGRLLFGGIGTVPADLAWNPAIGPIMGWLGAALLLRAPSPIHALRHPR